MLGEQGDNTICLGKWHLTPVGQLSMGASERSWPPARGFARFSSDYQAPLALPGGTIHEVVVDVGKETARDIERDIRRRLRPRLTAR